MDELNFYHERKRLATAPIVTGLEGKPLRAVKSARTPGEMCRRPNARYAANTIANIIGVLSPMLNFLHDSGKYIGEYLVEL